MTLARALGQLFVALVRPTRGGRRGRLSLHVAGTLDPRRPLRLGVMAFTYSIRPRRSAMDSPDHGQHPWTVFHQPGALEGAGARM